MVLRESGRVINKAFNIEAIIRPGIDVGVEGGEELLAFADTILGLALVPWTMRALLWPND
jgi:hypothetical protein